MTTPDQEVLQSIEDHEDTEPVFTDQVDMDPVHISISIGNHIDQLVLYTWPGFAIKGNITHDEKEDTVDIISNHHPLYNFWNDVIVLSLDCTRDWSTTKVSLTKPPLSINETSTQAVSHKLNPRHHKRLRLCGRENIDIVSPINNEVKLGIVTLDNNKGEDFTPLKVNDHTKLSHHILLISTRSSVPSTNTSVICKSKAKIELAQKIQNIKKMNIFFIIKL